MEQGKKEIRERGKSQREGMERKMRRRKKNKEKREKKRIIIANFIRFIHHFFSQSINNCTEKKN